MNPRGMNIPDAAAHVGVSERTIRRAIERREIVTRYAGRKVIVDVASLNEWFDALPTERQAS